MTLPPKTAVIGRIPGYNSNIDQTGEFEGQLLKGLTFIDLRPMTYTFGPALNKGVPSVMANLPEVLKQAGLFTAKSDASKKIFQGILKRMQENFGLDQSFPEVEMIRIVGTNDSTFTETFTSSFGEENSLVRLANDVISGATGGFKDIMAARAVIQKGMKGYSHADMINYAGELASFGGNATGSAGLGDMMTGAMLGMNMAAPAQWGGSQYTSNLTLFIKLVAPVGTPECIRKNILEPILYLLAASSPLTYSGIMYGFPLLWDIQAHGITNFRLGGIAAMSLIRGSFETTFNYLLQPTIIDVRLSLVPLLNDFAVQTKVGTEDPSNLKDIYQDANKNELGVQNPADINRGLMNQRNITTDQIYTVKL